MKRNHHLNSLLCIACGLSLQLAGGSSRANEPISPRPNFVFVLAEAQGWSSTSTPMDDRMAASKSDLIITPNLDRLAKEGMRFASAYAPSPRCTPSRASLFTGKSPAALHMTFVGIGRANEGEVDTWHKLIAPTSTLELPRNQTTIAEVLKRNGYATAHFGKWHVGHIDPSQYGFDESDGPNNNGGPENLEHPNPKQAYAITDRGIEFMKRQVKAGKPFYLQISHYPGRGSADAMQQTVAAVRERLKGMSVKGDKDRRLEQAAIAEDMDVTIGMLLKSIDDLGIAGNTYVIYTADHGAQGRNANAPLSNGKGTVWEGGIRVPLIIRGPGILPGACSHMRAIGQDLFPTIAGLAHLKDALPQGIEGGSLIPVLDHGGVGEIIRPRDEMVIHFPHYDNDEDGPASAILLGNFKLIRFYSSGQLRLYNLANDPAERMDLANDDPTMVKELDAKLSAYLKDVDAQLPIVNPHFDPSKTAEMLKPRKRKNNNGQ